MTLQLFDLPRLSDPSPPDSAVAISTLRDNLTTIKACIQRLQQTPRTQERAKRLKRQYARLELTQIQLQQLEAQCKAPPTSFR